jgi:hypothetical protein
MLEYTLEENRLTDTVGDYRAQVVNVKSYSTSELTEKVMEIGAGLTRSDVASVLEATKQVIGGIIKEGGAINFDLFHAYPSMQGVFTSYDDSYDPSRHTVKINLQPGSALRKGLAGVKVKKVVGNPTGTIITSVIDVKSGTINDMLTPGRDLKLAGKKLKIAGEDAGNGIFFVSVTGESIMVDPSDIVVNNPAEIIALIPELAAGTYQVRIVTQYSSGKALITPHAFTCEKELTVA